jgi:hypothetical protein
MLSPKFIDYSLNNLYLAVKDSKQPLTVRLQILDEIDKRLIAEENIIERAEIKQGRFQLLKSYFPKIEKIISFKKYREYLFFESPQRIFIEKILRPSFKLKRRTRT